MKYAYYPGCALHSSGSEFDISLKAICSQLELELEEVRGWICCGSTPAHSVSELLALALPVANLSLVEQMDEDEVVVPCASCFRRLKAGQEAAAAETELATEIHQVVGRRYRGSVQVSHPLEVFCAKEMLRQIAHQATADMSHLRVVCYYGCLLTRPPKLMQFDQHEYPMSMDDVLRAAGIRTLDWDFKTMCCGAALSLTETDIVYKLTADILDEAQAVGANAVAVACPLCHANLDTRQSEIEERKGKKYRLPVFYFTQLIGLAMGIASDELGLEKHLVDTGELIRRRDELPASEVAPATH